MEMSHNQAGWHDGGDPGRAEFRRQVRDALAHLHDFAFLQTHPFARLARPDESRSDAAAGKLLQRALGAAIDSLRPDPPVPLASHVWRTFQILELRYLEGLDVAAVQARLALGKSEYHDDHRRALDAVASHLWERWGPAWCEIETVPDPDALIQPAAIPSPTLDVSATAATPGNLPFPLTSFV